MSDDAERIKEKLGTLSVEERAELAEFLISSLDSGDADFDDDLDAKLASRAKEIDGGLVQGKPADEVLSELWKKHA